MRAPFYVLLIALVACKVDGTHYVLPGDGDAAMLDGGVDGAADIDAAGARLQVAPSTPIALLEGGSTSVVIRLSAAPTAPVTVTITPSDPGVTVAPATWMFAPDDWGDKILTVRATQDDDAASISGDVAFQSSAGTVSVPVTVTDDDRLGLFVAPASTSVLENTDTTIQVSLTARPASNVTVAVSSSNTQALTATTTSVTFAPGEWDTLKPVTLHGVADVNTVSESVNVTLAASGLTDAVVAVTVTDDDVLNLAVTPSAVSGTEGGAATPDVSVALTQAPPGPVAVAVTSSDPTHAVPSVATLNFTTANFATPQTVRVNLPADVDHADSAATVSFGASGIATQTVNVSGTDPDVQAILAGATTLTTQEGTASVPINVRLAFAPQGATTVDVTTAGPIGIDTSLLTFTAAGYATAQTIHVSIAEDADLATDTATVTLTSPDAAEPVVITLTISDNDTQVINAPTAVTVDEGGSNTFDVTLGFQPLTDTTVTVTSLLTGVSVAPAALTFTTTTWGAPQVVTVTAGTDGNGVNETGTVRLTAGTAMTNVGVTVRDTTATGLVATPTTVALAEGGTATVKLTLSADPGGASYTVNGASSDPSAVVVSGSPMVTLNGGNWQTGVDVTLVGVADADAEGETVLFTWTDNASLNASATVNVTDDDVLGLQFTPPTLAVPEGGTRTVAVTLSAPPTGTVTVNVTAGTANQIVSGSTLTFTGADWNTDHPVTIRSVRDDDRNDGMSGVLFTPDGGVPPKTLMVHQSPDDTIWVGRFVGMPTSSISPSSPTAWLSATLARNDTMPTLPSCLIMDRFVVAAQTGGMFFPALYAQSILPMPVPGNLIYAPPSSYTATMGLNTYDLAGAGACAPNPSTYVALYPAGGVTPGFTTVTSQSVAMCAGSGSGSGAPSATWVPAGPCTPAPAAIAYFIVHPAAATCTCL